LVAGNLSETYQFCGSYICCIVLKHVSFATLCDAAGVLAVKRVAGVPTVFPADSGEVTPEEDMLQVRKEQHMNYLAQAGSTAFYNQTDVVLFTCSCSHFT
jgi:hypothetical protein